MSEVCQNPFKKCRNKDIAVTIYYNGEMRNLCSSCWKEIAESDLEWSSSEVKPKRVKRSKEERERIKRYILKRASELGGPLLEKRRIIRAEVMEKFGVKRKSADWLVWTLVRQ